MGHRAILLRRRLGLTQVEFARRIDVSHETVRNWEQGKRGPTGAARTLLRILRRLDSNHGALMQIADRHYIMEMKGRITWRRRLGRPGRRRRTSGTGIWGWPNQHHR